MGKNAPWPVRRFGASDYWFEKPLNNSRRGITGNDPALSGVIGRNERRVDLQQSRIGARTL